MPPPLAVAIGAAGFDLPASADAVSAFNFATLFWSHIARPLGWAWPPTAIVEAAAQLRAVMDGCTPAHTGGFFDYSGAEILW